MDAEACSRPFFAFGKRRSCPTTKPYSSTTSRLADVPCCSYRGWHQKVHTDLVSNSRMFKLQPSSSCRFCRKDHRKHNLSPHTPFPVLNPILVYRAVGFTQQQSKGVLNIRNAAKLAPPVERMDRTGASIPPLAVKVAQLPSGAGL